MRPSRDDRNRHSRTGGKWPAGRPTSRPGRIAIVVAGGRWPSATARADDRPANPDGVDFFESKVRPVLVEHCYKCHSAQARSPKGGLRLDSLDGMKKGGDTGPAVVPGDVEASLLVQAVRYKDEQTRMPPKGKLPEPRRSPRSSSGSGAGPSCRTASRRRPRRPRGSPPRIDFEAARSHWAYQPIRRPAIPAVKDANWPSSRSTRSCWPGWKPRV